MWEILSVLLLVTVAVGMLAPRLLRQRPSGDSLSGTLLITGVIAGPTNSDYTVYRRMVADVEHWPAVGELKPVVYSQRNPDKWLFAPPDLPPALPTD